MNVDRAKKLLGDVVELHDEKGDIYFGTIETLTEFHHVGSSKAMIHLVHPKTHNHVTEIDRPNSQTAIEYPRVSNPILPINSAGQRDNSMQFEKPIIQRNILALKEMIETTTNPEAKVALKLRLVEWAQKLQQ